MTFSSSFMSSGDPDGFCIMSSNALRSATSSSATIVQYRSAEKSVMMRIAGIPIFLLNLFIAWNFSTIGRTLPGLQYMISRTRYMAVLRVRWTFGESRAVGDGRWAIGDDGLDKRGHRPPPIADRRQSHRPPPIPTALLCNGFANSIARRERSSHLACPFHHPGQLPEAPMATTATTT